MRIVVIGGWAPSLIQFRGPLLAALVARGHDVIAMAADGTPAITAALARLGVRFEPLALERTGLDPRSDLRALWALRGRLRALAPELVLGYTIKPVIYGSLAARLAGVPRRVAMITGLGSVLADPRTPKQRALATLATGLYRLGLAQCELVFFQNPDDRAALLASHALPRATRTEIVRGSGVDLAHYAPSALPPGPLRFLFVGRLLRDKGIAEYVAAARAVKARHPAATFQIAGWFDPNPESLSEAELAAATADGIVDYLGNQDDIRPTLAAAHVLVLPSYREGTPRSVLEAMAIGRAVITTTAPGCRETVVHDESGLLVPMADAPALAAAMTRMLEEPGLVARLAAAGHARCLDLYDSQKVAASVINALRA